MIAKEFINELTEYIKNRIKKAAVMLDGKDTEVNILRIDCEGNVLKVYVNMGNGKGEITDIKLLGEDNKVIISKPRDIKKNNTFGVVCTFYVRIQEIEDIKPNTIFDIEGVRE